MIKKYLLLTVLFFVGLGVWADLLNSRTAGECMRQVSEFLDDNKSYYELQISIYTVAKEVIETNQITVEREPDSMFISIHFNNEVMFKINISKSAEKSSSNDGVAFNYSRNTGYCTTITKHYDKYRQYDIETILNLMFQSFKL
jgi:hypothetical protein